MQATVQSKHGQAFSWLFHYLAAKGFNPTPQKPRDALRKLHRFSPESAPQVAFYRCEKCHLGLEFGRESVHPASRDAMKLILGGPGLRSTDKATEGVVNKGSKTGQLAS